MTFQKYCELIRESVAEQGYDAFFPSMCISERDIEIKVLYGDLSPEGEEAVAKDWAAAFEARRKLLAYRVGDRCVDVCEIIDNHVVDKLRIRVEPALAE